MEMTLNELEQAINYWRLQRPAQGKECTLSPEVNLLAGIYALMIFHRQAAQPLDALPAAAQQLLAAARQPAVSPEQRASLNTSGSDSGTNSPQASVMN